MDAHRSPARLQWVVIFGGILLVSALGARPAFGQQAAAPDAAHDDANTTSALYVSDAGGQRAKPRLHTAGKVLTVLGLASLMIGTALIASASNCNAGDRCGYGPAGIGVVSVGALAAVIGVPMWVVGRGPLEHMRWGK